MYDYHTIESILCNHDLDKGFLPANFSQNLLAGMVGFELFCACARCKHRTRRPSMENMNVHWTFMSYDLLVQSEAPYHLATSH